MSITFLVIVAYLVAISVMGVYFGRFVKTQEDFTVAGRRLGGFVLAGTLFATWFGSGLVVGGPTSLGYMHGHWVAIAYVAANPCGIIVMYLLANKIRQLGKQTIPDILEDAYGSIARIIGSIIIILAYVGIASYQFTGFGFVLNATLGIPVSTGTVIAVAVIIITAVFGGLLSVAYTDCLSALMMVLGLVVGIPTAIHMAGGWSSITSRLPPENLGLGGLSTVTIIGYFLPLFLLLVGDQNMYQRFFAGKSEKDVKAATVGWLLGALAVIPVVAMGASASRVLNPGIPPGQALISLASKWMPVGLGAVAIAAMSAFMITTGNSYLLSAAVNLSWDIYSKYINRNAGDAYRLWVTRGAVVLLGLIAYSLIAYFPTVLAIQMYAYTMYGASITPAVLGALLWKKATPAAGIASMLTGSVMTIVWESMGKPLGLGSILIAAPLSIIVLLLVGNATCGVNCQGSRRSTKA